MRGQNRGQLTMLAAVTVESFVPAEHPFRPIKAIADRCFANMDAELSARCAAVGRPSIPPERLLKGQLLIALFSLRGKRQRLRAARLQHDAPLVPGHGGDRRALRPHSLQQEP